MSTLENMVDEGKRLEAFINYLKIKPNKFAKEIGVSQPLISQVKTGTRKFTRELANKIAARYPEFNEAWIYTGKGGMLKLVETYQIEEGGQPRTLADIEADYRADPLSGLRDLIARLEELERWRAEVESNASPNEE
jgi:plasmid maintenance system antidote protein VapI